MTVHLWLARRDGLPHPELRAGLADAKIVVSRTTIARARPPGAGETRSLRTTALVTRRSSGPRTAAPARFVRFDDETAEATAVCRDICQRLPRRRGAHPGQRNAILFRTTIAARLRDGAASRKGALRPGRGDVLLRSKGGAGRHCLPAVLSNPTTKSRCFASSTRPRVALEHGTIEVLLSEAISRGQRSGPCYRKRLTRPHRAWSRRAHRAISQADRELPGAARPGKAG